jgi:hypothetical protein
MIFWRIVNDKLYPIQIVENLGFEKSEKLYIPDEYLEQQSFTVCRSCLGIGDWGIISAMPRLLKQKYPNCTVKIPSQTLLRNLFEPYATEWLKSWNNPYETMEYIFKNNPYVDEYVDTIEGDIFHDHYRIYDKNTPEIPLLEQMLEFWQFTPEEYSDSSPELYFTKEEREEGDNIIKQYSSGEFGTLLISNRFDLLRDKEFIQKSLNKYKLPYFYWVKDLSILPIFDAEYVLDLKNIPIRIQMYIKTQANVVIGNMSGADIMFPRYTKVYMAPREEGFNENIVKGNLVTNKQNI